MTIILITALLITRDVWQGINHNCSAFSTRSISVTVIRFELKCIRMRHSQKESERDKPSSHLNPWNSRLLGNRFPVQLR